MVRFTDVQYTEFPSMYEQLGIRSVGVNYNQVVKQLHTNFGEKKALAMLYKLEQETI